MNKHEILKQALTGREEEILHYQINIDNYSRAIQKAVNDVDLVEFVEKLKELLSSSIVEQKKAIIMRDVIREQVEDQG